MIGPGSLRLAVALVALHLVSSCAAGRYEGTNSSPTTGQLPTLEERGLVARLADRVGHLPFVPLPPNYPPGYAPHERVFTGEVFTKDPSSTLDPHRLVFFPKDYLTILESSFVQTLRSRGIAAKPYRAISQAREDNCQLLVWGAPLSFHVDGDTNAIVRILYTVIALPRGDLLAEEVIETPYSDPRMPPSITSDTLVFMVGNHEFNFQPQRALLAIASARNAAALVDKLASIPAGSNR